MKVHELLPLVQAQRIVPGVPCAILCLCRGSLATLVPAKVVGLVDRFEWLPHWPTDFVGTAVFWRSDRGDGQANSFR